MPSQGNGLSVYKKPQRHMGVLSIGKLSGFWGPAVEGFKFRVALPKVFFSSVAESRKKLEEQRTTMKSRK